MIILRNSYYQKEFGIRDTVNNIGSSARQFFGNIGTAIANPVDTGNKMLSLRTRARIEATKRGAKVVGQSIGAGMKRLGQQAAYMVSHPGEALRNTGKGVVSDATVGAVSTVSKPAGEIMSNLGVNINTRRAGLLKKYYLNPEFRAKYDALYGDKKLQQDKDNGAWFPTRRPDANVVSFNKPTEESAFKAVKLACSTGKRFVKDVTNSKGAQASALKKTIKGNAEKLIDGNKFVNSLATWRTTPNESIAGGLANMRTSGGWDALGAVTNVATGGASAGLINGATTLLNGSYIGPGTNDLSVGVNLPEDIVKYGLGAYNEANKDSIAQERSNFLNDKETRRLQGHINSVGKKIKGIFKTPAAEPFLQETEKIIFKNISFQ